METISNAAAAASKIIWGEGDANTSTTTEATSTTQHRDANEPVAGETGKGTGTDPFDAGNKDENTHTGTGQTTSSTGTGSGSLGKDTTGSSGLLDTGDKSGTAGGSSTSSTLGSGATSGDSNTLGSTGTSGSSNPLSHSSSSGNSNPSGSSSDPSSTLGSGATSGNSNPPGGSSTFGNSGSLGNTGTSETSNPSGSSGPSSNDFSGNSGTVSDRDTTAATGQGASTGGIPRPEHDTDKTGVTSVHQNDPHGSDIRPSEANENKPGATAGGVGAVEPSVGADPASAQQPTPKQQGADRPSDAPDSTETAAVKDQKDDAENVQKKKDPNDHSGEPLKMHDGSADKDKKEEHPGQPGGNERGKEEGTGEKWIKTSGLAADGGDFDAAQAGAGKEADRLLETKGIHKEEGGGLSPSPNREGEKAEKQSVKDKIKEKLHIGKH